MKNAAFLLGLALAAARALAISHVIVNETAPGPAPLVASRHFQARSLRDPDFQSSSWTIANAVPPLSGVVVFAVTRGVIFHAAGPVPQVGDQSAIARFQLPAGASTKNCQVILNLDPSGIVAPGGSQFQVFLLSNFPTASQPGFVPIRGPSLGVLTANPFIGALNGDSSGPAITFPCNGASGGFLTLEFAPYDPAGVGESISWDTVNGGPIVFINP